MDERTMLELQNLALYAAQLHQDAQTLDSQSATNVRRWCEAHALIAKELEKRVSQTAKGRIPFVFEMNRSNSN